MKWLVHSSLLIGTLGSLSAGAQTAVLPARVDLRQDPNTIPAVHTKEQPVIRVIQTSACLTLPRLAHAFTQTELEGASRDSETLVIFSRGIKKNIQGFKSALLHYETLPLIVNAENPASDVSFAAVKTVLGGGTAGSLNPSVIYFHDGKLQKNTLANQLAVNRMPNLVTSASRTAVGSRDYATVARKASTERDALALGLQSAYWTSKVKTLRVDGKSITDDDYPIQMPVYVYWRDSADGLAKKREAMAAVEKRVHGK